VQVSQISMSHTKIFPSLQLFMIGSSRTEMVKWRREDGPGVDSEAK